MVGYLRAEPRKSAQGSLEVDLVISDETAAKLTQQGKLDAVLGYSSKLEDAEGVHASSEAYDSTMTGIVVR
jgi:hypothetical protein